jgi:hypothetical protein
MAQVARTDPKTRSLPDQILYLTFGFQADAMAAPATLKPFHLCHRLPVERGHGLHRAPGKGMLPLAELPDLRVVALCADIRTRKPCVSRIGHRIMPVAVARGTTHIIGAVLAQLPVDHNAGSDAHVAFGTWVVYLRGRPGRRLGLAFILCLLGAHCAQTEKN